MAGLMVIVVSLSGWWDTRESMLKAYGEKPLPWLDGTWKKPLSFPSWTCMWARVVEAVKAMLPPEEETKRLSEKVTQNAHTIEPLIRENNPYYFGHFFLNLWMKVF